MQEEELTYVPLQWRDNQWVLKDCPYTKIHGVRCQEWLARQELPVPEYRIRDHVKFDWSRSQLHGEIESIEMCWIVDGIFTLRAEFRLEYHVRANGHIRHVRAKDMLGLWTA